MNNIKEYLEVIPGELFLFEDENRDNYFSGPDMAAKCKSPLFDLCMDEN